MIILVHIILELFRLVGYRVEGLDFLLAVDQRPPSLSSLPHSLSQHGYLLL